MEKMIKKEIAHGECMVKNNRNRNTTWHSQGMHGAVKETCGAAGAVKHGYTTSVCKLKVELSWN